MNNNKILIGLAVILFCLVFAMSLTSGSLWSYIRSKITGEATQQNLALNITLGNSAPNITWVQNNSYDSAQTVTESGQTMFFINFTIIDTDGVSNINGNSIVFNITNGSVTRQNTTCINFANDTATSYNVTCSADIWYFDTGSVWTIGTYVSDVNGAAGANSTTTFTLGTYDCIAPVQPGALTWGSSVNAGSTNVEANNDPVSVNNTCNTPHASVLINATHLSGETTGAEKLWARNFTSHISDVDECGSGTGMVNQTFTSVTSSTLPTGNNTANAGIEQLYFCLTQAGSELTVQSYSTGGPNSDGPWQIKGA